MLNFQRGLISESLGGISVALLFFGFVFQTQTGVDVWIASRLRLKNEPNSNFRIKLGGCGGRGREEEAVVIPPNVQWMNGQGPGIHFNLQAIYFT